MPSKIVTSFLETKKYFASIDIEKMKALQKRCDDFHRQMRNLEPTLEEKHLGNLQEAYLENPSPARLDSISKKEESLHHLKANNGVHLGIVLSAYGSFLRSEVLPWLLTTVTRLQTEIAPHLDEIENAEKARSVGLLGNDSGAAGYVAHCGEVRRLLNSLPGRFEFQFGGRNPYTTLRSGIKEMATLGFDLGLIEACGEIEPMVETRAERNAKRNFELRKADDEKMAAAAVEAQAKEEAARIEAAKTYATQPGDTFVVKPQPPAANSL